MIGLNSDHAEDERNRNSATQEMDKQRERAIVEGFVRWSGHPGLLLRDWNRERPDALIAAGDQLIGVEITAIREAMSRHSTAPQKWSAEAFRIVDAARKAFEARSQTQAVVRFEMRPGWNPPVRSQAAKLADDFASLIEQILGAPAGWPLDSEPHTLRDPHPAVAWVYVSRSDHGNHWQPSISGEARAVSEADVRATVARKDVHLTDYRQVAPSVWLLIDCDVSAQGIALDVPTCEISVATGFDRIFCCGFGMWQWVEVSVTKTADVMAG